MQAVIKAKTTVFRIAARTVQVEGKRVKCLAVLSRPRGKRFHYKQEFQSTDFIRCLGWILAQVMEGK